MRLLISLAALFILCFEPIAAGEPIEIEISAIRDSGFFNQNVNQNMGSHTHVPVGQTNDGRINRSVFDFSVVESIPTINTVVFEFTVTNQGGDDGDEQAPADFELHRVTTPWAEGTGFGNMGQQTNDGVTWLAADPTNGTFWNTNGGDFDSISLGSVYVDNEAIYQISELLSNVVFSGTELGGVLHDSVGEFDSLNEWDDLLVAS